MKLKMAFLAIRGDNFIWCFQELLKHQIKEHGVKSDTNWDSGKSINSSSKGTLKYHKRIGTILPESVHTIECKLCNREFHAQSRTLMIDHLRKEHEDVTYKNNIDNRYAKLMINSLKADNVYE